MKIAYLGPRGTFSEEAAFGFFTEQHIDWHMFDSIFDVLSAVENDIVEKGIVPIENSIEGTITATVDELFHQHLFIESEVILPVTLHLLTLKGVTIEDIREVWSISPALAQCREEIKTLHANTKQFNSTAQAAETLQQTGQRDAAAIASRFAAETFQLQIAKESIQDHAENHTKFIVVTKKQNTCAHPKKTMLLITPNEDYPGLLSVILNVFTALSINITWIESRPTKKKLGTYRFYIEAVVGLHTEKMSKAITILETFGHQVRVLGSYDTKEL